MPKFEIIPLSEAKLRTMNRRVVEEVSAYLEHILHIQQLGSDLAGVLVTTEGENILTIRHRLKTAAEMLGKTLTTKRAGEELYFWVEPAKEEKPRRSYRRRRETQETGAEGEAGAETATGEAPGSP